MTDPGAHPDVSAGPTAREEAFARRLLLAVGAGYLLIQFALFSFHRAPRWDEAVYLSQVTPGAKAQFFAPFRARGITLLIAPITWWGGSVAAVRLFLTAVSAMALTAAFWVWIPFIGIAAPVAALLFGFSWVGLLNGSEIFPNFWAATLGLAVAGLVCRRLADGGRRSVVVASMLLAALALFRPTEATAVFGVLGVYLLVFKRPSWRVLLPIGLGLAIGWLPWVTEMSVRFGGPLTALREAGTAHFALASVAGNVRQYVAYTDGGIRGPEAHRIPLAGVLWWSWLIVMAVVAVAQSGRATAHAAVLLCSLGALALATQYVIFVSALAPRYLLPAIAFVSIPAAFGVVSLIRGGVRACAAGAIALLLVVPWGIWQASVANRFEAQEARYDESLRVVGFTLREEAGGRPCTFISLGGTAQIALASGCEGTQVLDPGPTVGQLKQLSSSGNPAFVILPRAARPHSPLGTMTSALSPGSARKTWFIYQFSA
jgi:hypothetical protein